MYLDFTEKELEDKFNTMSVKAIVDFLMEEGLELKSSWDQSFRDLPLGIYRRVAGRDLIRLGPHYTFNYVDQYPNVGKGVLPIDWSIIDDSGKGDWWIQVLDHANIPVKRDPGEFRVNSNGERTG